jgi:metallophosphoesterase (TIGR00282 family)
MPDKFVFLAIGDIVGRPGRKALKRHLLSLCQKYNPSLIIANGENAAGGVGITEKIGRELFAQVDVLTSGNHIWDKKEAIPYLEDEPKLLRPANYPSPNPGKGSYIYKDVNGIEVGILNLQGRVFMEPLDCPFRVAEREIKKIRETTPIIIVDFHAEATSEKQALGWFLDGKVTAVIGTHTHVVTADERILPNGTAYITDIGMVGGLNSVIGIRRDQGVQRFLTARPQRFEPEKEGMIFAALIVEADIETGRALSIRKEIFIEDGLGNQQLD